MITLTPKHKKNISFLNKFLTKGNFDWVDYNKKINLSYFSKGGGTYLYLIKNKNNKFLARINYYSLKNKWKTKRQEYKILKIIESLNIAPHIYVLNEKNSLGQHFVIVDYIEGNEIKKFDKKKILHLAETLKKLHKFKIKFNPKKELPYKCEIYSEFANGEDKQIEKYRNLRNIRLVTPIYNQIKEELEKWFNNLDIFKDCANICLCHADLKKENILATSEGVKLIDWECAGLDIPETDIGRLFSGCRFNKKQQNLFLNRYYKKLHEKELLRIEAIKMVLDFFIIIEDYCIHKRKKWSAKKIIRDLLRYEKGLKEFIGKVK